MAAFASSVVASIAIRWPFSSPRSASTPSTQPNTHETPQRQRIRQPPGNPALRPDALEIPDQQRPKVNPRRQGRTPVLGRIKLRAPLLDKLVEALRLQQLVQALVERMSRRRRQLAVRDPDVLLLLPLLARPHRHAPILRTNSVDTSQVSCSRTWTCTTG